MTNKETMQKVFDMREGPKTLLVKINKTFFMYCNRVSILANTRLYTNSIWRWLDSKFFSCQTLVKSALLIFYRRCMQRTPGTAAGALSPDREDAADVICALYRGLCQSLRHPHRPYGTAAFHDWAQKLRLPLFFSGKILYNGICLFKTLFK